MQINPNKEYLKRGIFDLFFKGVKEFEKVNNIVIDMCNPQQDMDKELWFMVPRDKVENEQIDFIQRFNSIGFIFSTKEIIWENKKYNYYVVNLPEENILKVVDYYASSGHKSYCYYDIKARMSIEAWTI